MHHLCPIKKRHYKPNSWDSIIYFSTCPCVNVPLVYKVYMCTHRWASNIMLYQNVMSTARWSALFVYLSIYLSIYLSLTILKTEHFSRWERSATVARNYSYCSPATVTIVTRSHNKTSSNLEIQTICKCKLLISNVDTFKSKQILLFREILNF